MQSHYLASTTRGKQDTCNAVPLPSPLHQRGEQDTCKSHNKASFTTEVNKSPVMQSRYLAPFTTEVNKSPVMQSHYLVSTTREVNKTPVMQSHYLASTTNPLYPLLFLPLSSQPPQHSISSCLLHMAPSQDRSPGIQARTIYLKMTNHSPFLLSAVGCENPSFSLPSDCCRL